MTDAMQLIGFGVVAALLALAIRPTRPEMALIVSLAAGVCLFIASAGKLSEIASSMRALADRAQISGTTFPLLLKIVGIAALCELGAQLCRDAGEGGIAAKVELGGKLMVLAMTMPVALALVELVLKILPA